MRNLICSLIIILSGLFAYGQASKVPYTIADIPPMFENVSDSEKTLLQNMFNTKLRTFFDSNFNKSILSKLGMTDRQRITTSFTIASDGTIKDVAMRASHDKIKDEMQRIFLLLKLRPGLHSGQRVDILYSFPYNITPNN